ncbi:DUF1707 domain-containing protein [Actinomadura keratinilytica]|jgi:hypothetical protein|uniref:DUF1707 domain-containing protein n=1 Tax=Actinomadura keratinilytica TaxID=547461 RepID=A0ABP7YZ89_9ACTN
MPTPHHLPHNTPDGAPDSASNGIAGAPPIRASDADRTAVIERLGDALAEGALDTAEYQRRLDAAAAAVTTAQLAPLTADLPVSRAAQARAAAARRAARARADKRAWFDEWSYWAGGAVIMTVIWAATSLHAGEWKSYWPAVPLGIWAAVLISYAVWPDKPRDDDPDEPHGPDTAAK